MTETQSGGQSNQPVAEHERPNAWRDASKAAKDFADWLTPPEEFRAHIRAARVEILKAIRALIDHRIEQLTRTDQRGTKIAVE